MAAQVTDRAHRYRAQKLAPARGRKVCAYCGSDRNVVPDHIDGVPDHTTRANLQWLCKSCNTAKGAAFAKAGRGRLTNQYNPAAGGVPTFEQYMWAVSNHTRGEHDEGGAVIHATPLHKRIEYARRIAPKAQATKQARFDERWNPPSPRGARNEKLIREYITAKAGIGWKPSQIYRAIWRRWGYLGEGRDTDGLVRVKMADGYEEFRVNPWPFSRPDARRTTPASGGIAASLARAGKGPKSKAADLAKYKGYTISRTEGGEYFSSLDPASWFETKAGVQRSIDGYLKGRVNPSGSGPFAVIASGKRSKWVEKRFKTETAAERFAEAKNRVKRSKRDGRDIYPEAVYSVQRANPAAASAEAFEEFHGFAPSEVVTVTKKVHYHKHLAAAGELIQLDVWGIDEQGHRIKGFKGAFLAFNESKNQLFVEGGDQSVNLADFGIDSPHELETLGRLTDIGYHTKKTHLGSEGGEAVYVHKFRSTNKNGKHVVVKIARYPDLIYDVRNEQLLFSGGSYEIIAEGIDK